MYPKLLFLDIETFKERRFKELTIARQEAFINHYYKEDENEYFYSPDPLKSEAENSIGEQEIRLKNIIRQYNRKAGLIPEFGRIICISIGYVGQDASFKIKCFKGTDEITILENLRKIADPLSQEEYGVAGWNTNGFDIPFIAKRYIINNLRVPIMFNPSGVKPWERLDVDVMQVWKCGNWNNVSLEVACSCLDIPVKFAAHTGKNIWEQEIEEIDWEDLEMYCNNDTYSSYLIWKRLDDTGYL